MYLLITWHSDTKILLLKRWRRLVKELKTLFFQGFWFVQKLLKGTKVPKNLYWDLSDSNFPAHFLSANELRCFHHQQKASQRESTAAVSSKINLFTSKNVTTQRRKNVERQAVFNRPILPVSGLWFWIESARQIDSSFWV